MRIKNQVLLAVTFWNAWIALQIMQLHLQRYYSQSNTAQAEIGLVLQINFVSAPIAIILAGITLLKLWLRQHLNLRLPIVVQPENTPVWPKLLLSFNLAAPYLLHRLLNYLR